MLENLNQVVGRVLLVRGYSSSLPKAVNVMDHPVSRSSTGPGLYWIVWICTWLYFGIQPGLAAVLVSHYSTANAVLSTTVGPLLLLLVYFSCFVTRKTLPIFRLSVPSAILMLLCVHSVLSGLFSSFVMIDPWRFYGLAFTTISFAIVSLTIVDQLREPHRLIRGMGRAFVIGTLLTAVIPWALSGTPIMTAARYGILDTIHPNTIGFRVGLALVFLASPQVFASRAFRLGASVFLTAVLLSTYSKTAWIGMVTAALCMWWSAVPGRKWSQGLVGVILALPTVVVMADKIAAVLHEYTASGDNLQTLSGRIQLWDLVVGLASLRPFFGYGLGTFRDVVTPFAGLLGWTTTIAHAHNAYLTVFLETGYLGAFLCLAFVATAAWNSVVGSRTVAVSGSQILAGLAIFVVVRSMSEGFAANGFELVLLATISGIVQRLRARPSVNM